MKLNRKQKVGIVLSVLWIISFSIFQRVYELRKGQEYSQLMSVSSPSCIETSDSYSLSECSKQKDSDLKEFLKKESTISSITFGTLSTLMFFWIIGFLILKTYRWIMK